MIKKILFLTFFTSVVFSQSTDYEFLGVIKLNGDDKNIISYRLVFSEQNNRIYGYSMTDLEGKHETKNRIEGTYNTKEKKLIFSENEIVHTKSGVNKYSFCFIHFEGEVNLKRKNASLKGNFKGFFEDQTPCINGTIEMVKIDKIEKMVNKVAKKIDKSKKIDQQIKDKINPIKMLDSLRTNTLSNNEILSLFVKSNEITLNIWDAGQVDNDQIDVFFNEEPILENYIVTKEAKTLLLPLKEGQNHIKIIAKNEGKIKPNTAKIDITDTKRRFEAHTNLKKNESTRIDIIRR